MLIVRPIELKDLSAYQELAFNASIGITTLPKNKTLLEKKVHLSLQSFQKKTLFPENELYIFVLEDTDSKSVGGTCAIFSKTGIQAPAYYYKVITEKRDSPFLVAESRVLHPISYVYGPSEVCGIFLKKEFRKGGLGKLLSFTRFLFMASFPHFFTKTIISSIRGRIDSQGNSPFWNSLGHHFLSKSLDEVFHLLEDQKISHKEIITPYPVHGALLSKKACQTIGKPHMNSTPAFKMLKNQGFSITDEIDIFDGGPKLMAELSDIHAITKSRTGFIKKISSNIENSTYSLICNQNHPFRVCYGEVSAKKEEVTLSSQVCEALQLEQGDAVRYLHIPKHH